MTPYQLVRAECANFSDSICHALADHECLVQKNERCEYFERCLLALPDMAGLANAPKYRSAVSEYRYSIMDGVRAGPTRPGTRLCDCGTPLPPRHRLCDTCKAKKRRHTRRQAQKRWRSDTQVRQVAV